MLLPSLNNIREGTFLLAFGDDVITVKFKQFVWYNCLYQVSNNFRITYGIKEDVYLHLMEMFMCLHIL